MALHIGLLGEHFAAIRALELLYLYLSCTMLLGSVFLQIDLMSGGEDTHVTHKVLGRLASIGTVRASQMTVKVMLNRKTLHTVGALMSFYGNSKFLSQDQLDVTLSDVLTV